MKINVFGLIRMAQAFAPVLKPNGGGAFVQINSVASLVCASNFATHSASKAAAYSITQALRELLGQQGTAVLSVHPGLIASDMGDAAGLAGSAEPPRLLPKVLSRAESRGFSSFSGLNGQAGGDAYRSFSESVIEADIPEYRKHKRKINQKYC